MGEQRYSEGGKMKLDFGLLPPEWTKQALCAEVDPVIFFPEIGDNVSNAKRICKACDVRLQCLDYSLQNNERYGIWGGLTEHDRRRLRREAS
jgi:WhiB family redox-sensing transcriptional regulator